MLYPDLDEVVLASTISIRKFQGPNTRLVVIPILPQHYVLLQCYLIYAAVTWGKKLVVRVSSKRALAMGIGNDQTRTRCTYLWNRLSLWKARIIGTLERLVGFNTFSGFLWCGDRSRSGCRQRWQKPTRTALFLPQISTIASRLMVRARVGVFKAFLDRFKAFYGELPHLG